MKPKTRYKPGDKIGGRYLVHQALMGGMGEVYLCLDLETDLPFALKTFQDRFLTSPKVRELFKEEVTTWIALEKHPNIVRCYFLDIIDNQPFMFLEWIAGDENIGTDLRSWLRRGPLNLRLTLEFMIDISRGLIHAQQKQPGIVHRDLKPDNILVGQGNVAKITDFGLAKIVKEVFPDITSAGIKFDGRQPLLSQGGIVGTPPYMSPEQWQGKPLDTRSDIYAVGCILYEMLTGQWPFQAKTISDLRRQHLQAEIPLLPESDLNGLLAKCMAKQQDNRFTTTEDLLKQITLIYQNRFGEEPHPLAAVGELTAMDYNNRGLTYYGLRHYKKALKDFNLCIQLEPNTAMVYSNRGNTYARLQEFQKALSDYNTAVQLDPNNAINYENRGSCYAKIGQFEASLGDFDRAIKLNPMLAGAHHNRGLSNFNLKRYREALADFDHAMQLNPTLAMAYANRGLTYYSLQQYDEALADFNRAIELDFELEIAYANRGLTYSSLKECHKAIQYFDRAIELNPGYVIAYYNRGYGYSKLGRYNEALADYTQAIQKGYGTAQSYYSRGEAYVHLQRFDEALEDFRQAVKLDPGLHQAYFLIGTIFFDRGDLNNALSNFEKAAQLGNSQGQQYAELVKQRLRAMSAIEENKHRDAFEAFGEANSIEEMRSAVTRYPFMADEFFISIIEQTIAQQQLPTEYQSKFREHLAWLRQIVDLKGVKK